MTREQIEKIASNCGIGISYVEAGKGGFIIDSSNIKYASLTDVVMDYFGMSNGSRKKYFVYDENILLAA